MSVLIKNMEIPKDCSVCPFSRLSQVDNIECTLLKEKMRTWDLGLWGGQEPKKFDGCPLVEVPTPHGEWIWDDKAVFERCRCSKCGYYRQLQYPEPENYCPNCGADMRGES